MKGLHALFIIAIAIVVFTLPSCGDAPTELGWENGYSDNINNIVWADGDQVWSGDQGALGGYGQGVRTPTKEVGELNGTVEAAVYIGGGWATAPAIIEETNSSSLSLNPGESAIYTIERLSN